MLKPPRLNVNNRKFIRLGEYTRPFDEVSNTQLETYGEVAYMHLYGAKSTVGAAHHHVILTIDRQINGYD